MFNNIITKHKFKKTVLIILIILIILNVTLEFYEKVTASMFFFLGITSSHVHFALVWAIILFAALFVYLFFKHKWIKILVTAFLLIGLIYLNFGPFFEMVGGTYYTIKSSDKKQLIVVRESPSMPGPGCSLYQFKNPFFIKRINQSVYFGSIAPFKDKLYTVEWQENDALLSFPVSEYNPSQIEIMVVKFY